MDNKSDTYYINTRKDLYPFIPQHLTKTLDVGCATGVFSRYLKQKYNNETWGIEMHQDSANVAKENLNKVLTGSFDEVKDKLPIDYFDCVFFNDVLEHMPYPEECLSFVKKNLSNQGVVFISLPNIRYIGVMREFILKKDWKYRDSGIMDKTHLRFFTKKSMVRMVESCGYSVQSIQGINSISKFCLTSILNKLLFDYIEDTRFKQYVIIAKPIR